MKQRRQFLRKLGGLTAMLALGSSGKAAKGPYEKGPEMPAKNIEGGFVHVVFFWLKQESSENKKRFLKELMKFVDNMDVIKSKHVGTPANTDREVIDSSYSFCLVAVFDSKKEHDIYQEHPLHKKFIENASDLWEKVLVYDSVNT